MPAVLRQMLGVFLRAARSPGASDTIARIAEPLLPARFNAMQHAGGRQFAQAGPHRPDRLLDHMYQRLCSIGDDPAQTIVRGEEAGSWSVDEMDKVRATLDPLDRTDACGFPELSDRQPSCRRLIRAAMAVALETRVPFLDKDVDEFAARIPPVWSSRQPRQMAGQTGALPARSTKSGR